MKRIRTPFAALVLGLAATLAPTARAQEVLPRPQQPFKGKIGRTAADSMPDFPKQIETPKGGTGTLSVDGKQVAEGKIERTVPNRFSLDETFDVGEDTGTPVFEDYVNKMPFKFTGVLKKVVIELGKSGLAASNEKKLEESNKKLAAVRD